MTNAEHRHLRLLLAHYRELDDPARVAVDAHLLTCADCRLALAAYAAAGMAGSGVLLLSTAWLEPLGVALIVAVSWPLPPALPCWCSPSWV